MTSFSLKIPARQSLFRQNAYACVAYVAESKYTRPYRVLYLRLDRVSSPDATLANGYDPNFPNYEQDHTEMRIKPGAESKGHSFPLHLSTSLK